MTCFRSIVIRLSVCIAATVIGGSAAAVNYRIVPTPGADLVKVAGDVRAAGGGVVQVLPEGTIFVGGSTATESKVSAVGGIAKVEALPALAPPVGIPARDPQSMGENRPSREQQLEAAKSSTRVTSVQPEPLSKLRAAAQRSDTLPAVVDNSLSIYFPPVRSQGGLGACTAWAGGYYYNTFTQARDENLTVSGGNNADICSPRFLYNVSNGGGDGGADMQSVMNKLGDYGCCNWQLFPYDGVDCTSWPDEDIWVEGFRRRTQRGLQVLGSWDGCSDADLLAIKQHLANGNVLVTRTDVYTNWYWYYPADQPGVNNGVLYSTGGSSYAGGHSIALVGYDDGKTYSDGTVTSSGAFLVANSWGPSWGVTNTGGVNKGFMWVGYDFFKNGAGTPYCFGIAWYMNDQPIYRPKLYVKAGLTTLERCNVWLFGGLGKGSPPPFGNYDGSPRWAGGQIPIDDSKRVACDLTDHLASIADPGDQWMFAGVRNDSWITTLPAVLSKVDLFHDVDGDGTFGKASSLDPSANIPGVDDYAFGYMSVHLTTGTIDAVPTDTYTVGAPQGGPVTTPACQYTVCNLSTTSFTYTVAASQPWILIDKAGGTLDPESTDTVSVSIDAMVDGFAAGTYTGTVTFTNTNDGTQVVRDVSLTMRPVASYAWNTIASPQGNATPFGTTIRALDSAGELVRAFTGTTSMTAQVYTTPIVGTGTSTNWQSYFTNMHDARTQTIFLASELGEAGNLTGLAFSIMQAPKWLTLTNFTIRIKHTPLSSYSSGSHNWESTGWTTVYQGNVLITQTGWVPFTFQSPFAYDGVSNIMVDVSFNNSERAWTCGFPYYTATPTARSLNYETDSLYGDPLTWSGTTPNGSYYSRIPNMKFYRTTSVPASPSVTDSFTAGVWSGDVSVQRVANGVTLLATDAEGHTGLSNAFDIADLVWPDAPFNAAGPHGGPVSDTKDYYVMNLGAAPRPYTVATSQPWIGVSKTSGAADPHSSDTVTASITPAADTLPPGTHSGDIVFTVDGSIVSTRTVNLTIRPIAGFAWNTVPSPQADGIPFPVSARAIDSVGQTVRAFTGTAALSMPPRQPQYAAAGANDYTPPIHTLWHDGRTQAIYTKAEVGGVAGRISGLAIQVWIVPGAPLTDWTIRMKHTASNTLSHGWDNDGWTTVYSGTTTISSTGWIEFPFSTPFDYNGVYNLKVDFSFDNSAGAAQGHAYGNYVGSYRCIYGYSDSANGPPLSWSGTTPNTFLMQTVPNLRLSWTGGCGISPTQTGSFVSGVWNGDVMALEPCLTAVIKADDGASHVGYSNWFRVDDASRYVSISGNDDTGDGSPGNPLRTIQKGVDTAVSGGRVRVMPGTYAEQVVIDRNVSIIGDPGSRTPGAADAAPVVDGGGAGYTFDIGATNPATSMSLVGLRVGNGADAGVGVRNAANCIVFDCTLSSCSVALAGAAGWTTSARSLYTGCGTGILVSGGNLEAAGNWIRSNTLGVDVAAGSDLSTLQVSMEGNQIAGNATGARNLGTGNLNALNCWWGSVTGPFHSGNPSGTGNPVGNGVLYDPWYGKGNLLDDMDGDGYTNADEDLDLDGVRDPWETCFAPGAANRDSDGDGVEDGVELKLGTDPLVSDWPGVEDADGDGLPAAADPDDNNPDVDGDRFADGYEVALGTDPASGSSKPLLGDANNDGRITVIDATILRRIAAGRYSLSEWDANRLDVNRDGAVTTADADLLRQYATRRQWLLPTE